MQNAYKRETTIGFTYWELKSKRVHSKSKHKDTKREIRRARHKAKQELPKNIFEKNYLKGLTIYEVSDII